MDSHRYQIQIFQKMVSITWFGPSVCSQLASIRRFLLLLLLWRKSETVLVGSMYRFPFRNGTQMSELIFGRFSKWRTPWAEHRCQCICVPFTKNGQRNQTLPIDRRSMLFEFVNIVKIERGLFFIQNGVINGFVVCVCVWVVFFHFCLPRRHSHSI